MNINDAIVAATARLQDISETPALDAQVLTARALNRDRTYIIAHARDELSAEDQSRLDRLVDQRVNGTPVAYITGAREFWSLSLMVSTDTLIPRPETELLVELALAKIPAEELITVADIGTGSGAIALAIASEREQCRLVATDVSTSALTVSRTNADRLGVTSIDFREGRNLEPLGKEKFNLVVSNPPYIPETDPHLTRGDIRFEPRSALAAGKDGLDVIRSLIDESRNCLKQNGWLMIEHGYDQEQAVNDLFSKAGYQNIECYRDLADQPRVTLGQYSPGD